jgi:hypothetical protein
LKRKSWVRFCRGWGTEEPDGVWVLDVVEGGVTVDIVERKGKGMLKGRGKEDAEMRKEKEEDKKKEKKKGRRLSFGALIP